MVETAGNINRVDRNQMEFAQNLLGGGRGESYNTANSLTEGVNPIAQNLFGNGGARAHQNFASIFSGLPFGPPGQSR